MAATWHEGRFCSGPALAALIGALLIQVGANFANDYSDFKKGADTEERMGPTRVTQAGLLSPKQVLLGTVFVFALACVAGFYLLWVGGWPVAAIGIASILAAITYVGGPFPYGYRGLGEVFVFLFFGLAATAGTMFVQAGSVTVLGWLCAVPVGFLATAILVVNNLRDIETDAKAGKRTLAVMFGHRFALAEYRILLVASFAASACLAASVPWALVTWVCLPMADKLWSRAGTEQGKALNAVLADTARLELMYGVLLAIGLVVVPGR